MGSSQRTCTAQPTRNNFFKQLQNFWSEQLKVYDYVLVEAPSILPVADTVVLATQLDGIILVLDAMATPVDVALEAKTRLARVNAKVIGTVLNPSEKKTGSIITTTRELKRASNASISFKRKWVKNEDKNGDYPGSR